MTISILRVFPLGHLAPYMAPGGMSRRLRVPRFLYRMLFAVDLAISRRSARFCAVFFSLTLTRR